MIGKGQATYLQTLISQYAEANAFAEWVKESCHIGAVAPAEEASSNAKRKLDNYIAKLTETGK